MIDLARLINPTATQEYLQQLYGITDEGGTRWSLVTDGRMVLGVRAENAFEDFSHKKEMLGFLRHADNPATVDVKTMLAWLEGVDGTMPTEKECKACKGRKRVDCECDACGLPHDAWCENCESTGKTCDEPEPQQGTIRGRLFNRRYFKRALETVGPPGELGELTLSFGPSPEDPAHLSGVGWHFCVMPMRRTQGEGPFPELLP